MGNNKLTTKYKCYDDCRSVGCPRHLATLTHQSCSNSFVFTTKGQKFYFQPPEILALAKLLKRLAEFRVEAKSILENFK